MEASYPFPEGKKAASILQEVNTLAPMNKPHHSPESTSHRQISYM
jgi:hypothetical protein